MRDVTEIPEPNEVFYDSPAVLNAALELIESELYYDQTFVTVSFEHTSFDDETTRRSLDAMEAPSGPDDELIVNIELRIPNCYEAPIGSLYDAVINECNRRKMSVDQKIKLEMVATIKTMSETIDALKAELAKKA